jgi:hypothetical protein
MDSQTDDFSPQQSLRIIQAMIEKSKDSVADKSYYFLLWGWLVLVAALIQFVLKVIVRTELHPVAWNLMWIGLILSIWHGRKEKGRRKVKSYEKSKKEVTAKFDQGKGETTSLKT